MKAAVNSLERWRRFGRGESDPELLGRVQAGVSAVIESGGKITIERDRFPEYAGPAGDRDSELRAS